MEENHHLNEDENHHIERGGTVGPLQEHQQQHEEQEQAPPPAPPPFTNHTIAQEQSSAYRYESLSQSKSDNTMKQERQQLIKDPPLPPASKEFSMPKQNPQGQFLPSNSFPYFHLTEVDNPEFVKKISNTAKEVNKNHERKREPEAQKRHFSSIEEKEEEEQSESSHRRTKKNLNKEKAFDVAFTAESSIHSLPPAASNNHTKNILTMNESRSFFTADEERRKLHDESSMIPSSSNIASLLVGESTSRANTHHILSPRRKERKDEEMPFLHLRGYADTLPANKNLAHSCNTGLAERNEHSSEKQSRSFDPDPSLQVFDAQQTSKKNLFREYPSMSSGPFHSYYTTSDEDRGKQIASLQFNNAESHDKNISIAKQVSSNKKPDIDPSQMMLLLQGGENTFSLSTKNNSPQEASPCKPKSHEDMNKLIGAFFSSDDITFNVSGGKQEPKKDIVTYKFPLKVRLLVRIQYHDMNKAFLFLFD